MILAAVAALNKAMLPCLSLQNQFDPVQLFQPYYSISPRVSHYFWNVIAIACSYISNLGLEPACHVVWNNAFSFFKAKKKSGILWICLFFLYIFLRVSHQRQTSGWWNLWRWHQRRWTSAAVTPSPTTLEKSSMEWMTCATRTKPRWILRYEKTCHNYGKS